MKSGRMSSSSPKGFTLIEVVITIAVGAIIGSLVVMQLGTSLFHSADSVFVVRDEGQAEGWLERIISDYVKEMNGANFATALATIQARDYTAAPYNMPPTITLTRTYVTYDAGGNEVTAAGTSTNLKVTVQAGSAKLTSLLTAERSSASDPYVAY